MSRFLCIAKNVKLVFGLTKFVAYSSAAGYAVARNMGLPPTAAEVALLDKIRAQLCDCHKVQTLYLNSLKTMFDKYIFSVGLNYVN